MLATDVNGIRSMPAVSSNLAFARKGLEEEMEEHLNAIIMIKRRLNALTTISRLPSEILSEIFVCVAQDYFRRYVDNTGRASFHNYPCGDPDWIRVAHVCHSWREIALTTPRLWSSIPVVRQSIADQLLARSKQAPLSVAIYDFGYDDGRMAFFDTFFSGQTSRLTELFVNVYYWIIYELCDKIMEPANLLHTLVLSDRTRMNSIDGSEHIPHNLFNGHTPRLRNLEIHGLVIRWNNPLLCSTLTSLVITACCNRKAMGTFDHLLSALEQMSSLHTLNLTNAIPRIQKASNSSSPSGVIAFPKLARLCLNEDAYYSAHFLGHISLAPNILPHLTCDGRPSEPLGIVQLLQEYYPSQGVRLSAWHTSVTFTDTLAITEPAPFVLELTRFRSLSEYQYIFQLSAAFTNIRTLVIETPEDRERAWTAIFIGTPNLCELVVQHRGPKSMLVVLSSTSIPCGLGDLEEEHTSSPLLPLLEMIKFNDVRLDGPIFGMKQEYFHQLVECTTFRRNYNCPLQEIHITRCRNVVEKDVERLRKIVPEVVWDGVVDVEDVPDMRDEEDEEDDEEGEGNEDEDEDSEDEDSEDEDEGDESDEDDEDDESDRDDNDEDVDDSTDDELGDDHPFGENTNSDLDGSDDDGA